ncbi:elongation factor P 5-aminopentanone reductase [Bacillus alkalicellulosilyticus]|uniref:elongation factor P 5-aminopentanone reductase n=1 Tax=Alkalihalobacterium alkalicellulosilyticum TaxID=1912214 RepID=UPI000997B1E0|nr:SDR family oxidoreductase [Bacillus alkalicellulosilyticus]
MNRTCLITGASGEIGAAIAIEFAAPDVTLFLHYHSNRSSIEDVKANCESKGSEVRLVQADLAKPSGVTELLTQLDKPIDIIIHNSGRSYNGLLTDMKEHEIEDMIRLHVTSPVYLTQALLPHMVREKRGHIIVISSIWGLTGASCEVLYSTVKGGMNSFVKALAKEVAPSGIHVNGIAPGAIDTKMLSDFSQEEKQALSDEIPLGRLGKPVEIANVAKFLISNDASYIQGQIISANGGWYC